MLINHYNIVASYCTCVAAAAAATAAFMPTSDENFLEKHKVW